ncbi:MAG: hypothetical protein ACRC2T_19035 [Thermoguttaceae bacterium]
MSPTHYKDYFTIDEKYKPVMTRDEFAKEPKKWLGFYPHPSFVEFLRAILAQMDQSKKSVWLTGAYGTGKTYAALVLQKLFNDSDENIKEWFTKRDKQFSDTIKDSLKKLRKSGVLAVFDTGSDALGAKDQFLVRIEQAIVKALQECKLQVPPKGELLDKIIERIKEEGSNFFATKDAIQDRLAHLNSSYTKFSELKKGLENEALRDGLLSDVQTVLWERSIYLGLSSQSLLTWIDAVLKQNNLSKLVFIWDEFSAYVNKNSSELKTLEELAEAAQQGKFYFIPVTHMKLDAYLASASESAKKANDRFEFKALDMPNDTAFKLVADAFQKIPGKESEWAQEQERLWYSVKDVVDLHFKSETDIQSESFREILPIHPMAAYVLKHLATFVGSNQRSLFDYLKNDAKGSEFRLFIESGGPTVEGKQILTVDHLWSYFVERDDLGQDRKVSDIKSAFRQKVSNLQPEEQRVFKAVLLFSLLGQMQGKDGHALLQPTVENIVQSFTGDGKIHGVESVLKQLQEKGCFQIVNNRCEMFRSNVNEEGLEKKKNELRPKFNSLVLAVKTKDTIEKKIKEMNIGDRFEVRVNSVDAVTTNIQNREQFSPDGDDNRILLQFILAKDREEKLKIPEKIKSLAKQFHDHRILFITVPITFCENNSDHWEEYIEYIAKQDTALDQAEKQRYSEVTDNWNEEWKRMLLDASREVTVYKPIKDGSPEKQTPLTWSTLKQCLLNFVDQTLPDCVDKYSGYGMNVFGTPSSLHQWAKAGISFQPAGAAGQAITAFKRDGITGDVQWFENNPQHSLTKIRNLCLEKLKNTIGNNAPCSVQRIS